MTVIDRANQTPLTPEFMKRVLKVVDALPPEDRSDLTARSMAMLQFVEKEGPYPPGISGQAALLIAIEFRMEALARLHKRPEYRAWSLKAAAQGQPDLIHEILIDVAATEPLIERNKRPAFAPQRFFRAVLALSEAQGEA